MLKSLIYCLLSWHHYLPNAKIADKLIVNFHTERCICATVSDSARKIAQNSQYKINVAD